jgi:methylation protein EvaC
LSQYKEEFTFRRKEMKCRACKGELKEFLDLGLQPLANKFVDKEYFDMEVKYELKVGMCMTCGLVQLIEQPPAHLMFDDKYPFYTSSSDRMVKHFEDTAEELKESLKLDRHSFVVEIGANDGTFLESFKNRKHVGFEPCFNLFSEARKRNLCMYNTFFRVVAAKSVCDQFGAADLIYAANTICHIANIREVFAAVSLMLKEKGTFVFEDPYLGDIIKNVSFDQIYDEHCFYFSIMSVMNIAHQHGLRLKRAQHLDTHGGSMRYYIEHDDGGDPGYVVAGDNITFIHLQDFANQIGKRSVDLKGQLLSLKQRNKKIVAYAATSKSTTLLNFIKINRSWVDCIYDTTPDKIGKFSPGMHIPIKDASEFEDCDADYAILFAHNHKDEIFEKTQNFKGKWITYVPRVEVIENDLCKQPA